MRTLWGTAGPPASWRVVPAPDRQLWEPQRELVGEAGVSGDLGGEAADFRLSSGSAGGLNHTQVLTPPQVSSSAGQVGPGNLNF